VRHWGSGRALHLGKQHIVRASRVWAQASAPEAASVPGSFGGSERVTSEPGLTSLALIPTQVACVPSNADSDAI
jgi:hypothetical protein